MTFSYTQFFSFTQVEIFIEKGLAIDGIEGGLLLGNDHKYDGIPMLMKFKDGYRIIGEVEGGEYLINPASTIKFNEELLDINNFERDLGFNNDQKITLDKIRYIDCRLENNLYDSKFLLLDARATFTIINKHSTLKHLIRLDKMNKAYKIELTDDLVEFNILNFIKWKIETEPIVQLLVFWQRGWPILNKL